MILPRFIIVVLAAEGGTMNTRRDKMTLEMLEFEYNRRQMTFEDYDTSVYIEMEDSNWDGHKFWLEEDQAYNLFWWLGEFLDMPMGNLEE
jgi:hypothetical protein